MELKFRSIKEIKETTNKIESQFWEQMLKMVDIENALNKKGFYADFTHISNDILDRLEMYDPSFYKYFIHNK